MRLYLAGPISGHPDGNAAAFAEAEQYLRDAGYDVVNPRRDVPLGTAHTAAMYADLRQLLERCTGVALLTGWEESPGACLEVLVAGAVGYPIRGWRAWGAAAPADEGTTAVYLRRAATSPALARLATFLVPAGPGLDEPRDAASPSTFQGALDAVWAEARQIMIDRQRKYSSGNIAQAGLVGILVRLQDKLTRIWHAVGLDALAQHGNVWDAAAHARRPVVTDEQDADPYLDGLNYFLIAELVRRGWWGLPLTAEEHHDDA
jgi:hypothetical protein